MVITMVAFIGGCAFYELEQFDVDGDGLAGVPTQLHQGEAHQGCAVASACRRDLCDL